MNNKYPQISFIYDRRKTATTTKKAAVEMRICYNYEQKYLSTGIHLYPNQWKNGKIVSTPDILQISQTLDKMLTEVRQILLEMIQNNNVDIDAIPEKLSARKVKTIGFIDFCNQRAAAKSSRFQKKSRKWLIFALPFGRKVVTLRHH